MLHTGRQRHHGEVVRVHHGVDVSGDPQRILGQRNALGTPATRGGSLPPIVGPPEGCLMAAEAFLPSRSSPWTRPMVVVDLPSPRGVGVMTVTLTYLPSCLPADA